MKRLLSAVLTACLIISAASSAVFAAGPYTVNYTANPSGGTVEVKKTEGDVTVGAGTTVDENTGITVTVTPDLGYQIETFEINGAPQTVSNPTQATTATHQVTDNVTINVTFEATPPVVPKYQVNYTASQEGGTVAVAKTAGGAVSSGEEVDEGTEITITATANPEYTLTSLKVNGSEQTSPYTVEVSEAIAIEATFTKNVTKYQVNYTASPEGGTVAVAKTAGGAVNPGDEVNADTEISITVTPNQGYKVATFTINGESKLSGDGTQAQNATHTVTAATTIAATFEQTTPPVTQYTVTYTAQQTNGSIAVTKASGAVNSGEKVDAGTEITITATPDQDYTLTALKVNGSDVTFSGNSATYTVNADINSIEATFTQNVTQYTVTYEATQTNGSIAVTKTSGGETVNTGDSVDEGTEITITATPDQDYTLTALKINGTQDIFDGDNSATYTVTANITSIEATFELTTTPVTQYTVSWTTPTNGSIAVTASSGAVNSGDKVNAGTEITITATADSGYKLTSLKVGGADFTSGQTYTVNADTTIEATFGKAYTVSTSDSTTGGATAGTTSVTTADGQTLTTVAAGDVIKITATPHPNEFVSSIKINNTPYSFTSAGAGNPVTLQITVTEAMLSSGSFALSVVYSNAPYHTVIVPSVSGLTVTATISGGKWYRDTSLSSQATTSVGAGTYYVDASTTATVTLKASSSSYSTRITKLTNAADSDAVLGNYSNASSISTAVTVDGDITFAITTTTITAPTSSAGNVSEPIAVQDEDGEPLEDNEGDTFNIGAIATDGRITLDGLAPGQTFYIKLGEIGFDPVTTLDCGIHTALASQLVDDDLFKISIDKDGDGKSLISSITQVSERNLDGTRGSYLKVVLKDTTTTEELKATAEITFKARKTLDASDGDEGTWESGDIAVLDLIMWINNIEATDSADTGDRIYINPEDNDENIFIWGDDRAALQFYADDDADSFYARLSTKSDVDIYTEYGDPVNADLWFYDFVGNPEIPCTSRAYLTLGIPWDDDDYYPDPEDCYIYEVDEDGYLIDVTDRFVFSEDDYEIAGWTTRTRVLGTYIVSDTELDIDSYDYEIDYGDEEDTYEDLSKVNPVTGGGDYYYTPVTPPASTGTTADVNADASTADGNTAEEDAEYSGLGDLGGLDNDLAVPEAVPSVSEDTDTASRASIPAVALGIVIVLACLALAGGIGYYFYRRYQE